MASEPQSAFPWYDSFWLSDYNNSLDHLKKHYPDKVQDFTEAMEVFQCSVEFKTILKKNFISTQVLYDFRAAIDGLELSDFSTSELKEFGRFKIRNLPFFTEFQNRILREVEDLVGESLELSYNFLSCYSKSSQCRPHLDAGFAKWTLDVCINQSAPWPIFFSNRVNWPSLEMDFRNKDWEAIVKSENYFEEFNLDAGDAVVFSGPNQWHYRPVVEAKKSEFVCDLVFFHFIPRGTKGLCHPSNWAKIFGVPELSEIVIHRKNVGG